MQILRNDQFSVNFQKSLTSFHSIRYFLLVKYQKIFQLNCVSQKTCPNATSADYFMLRNEYNKSGNDFSFYTLSLWNLRAEDCHVLSFNLSTRELYWLGNFFLRIPRSTNSRIDYQFQGFIFHSF